MITCDLCLKEMPCSNDVHLMLMGVNEVCDDCIKIQDVIYKEIYDDIKKKLSGQYVEQMKVRFPNSRIEEKVNV